MSSSRRWRMDKLLSVVPRDFPGFEVTHVFEAGIPVYFTRLQGEALERQELTSFEIYFLHAVALGVNTRAEIAGLLGGGDRYLVAPGAPRFKRVYIPPAQPPTTQDQPVLGFLKGMLLLPASAVLQRPFGTQHFLLPDDALTLAGSPLAIPRSLPPVVAQVAQDLTDNELALRTLQTDLADSRARRGTTQDRREREALEDRILQLEGELRARGEEGERLRAQLQQNQGTFLRTEDHRAVLERALREAREEIIIICPWMNRRTCDDDLCDLVAHALKRGVRIRIGYGITERVGDADAGRNRANAQKVIRAIAAAVALDTPSEQARLLDIQRTGDTHQKILVCDRSFGVLGSFNWLSYRGERDKEYRNETSILLRDPASVIELAQIALRGWPQ